MKKEELPNFERVSLLYVYREDGKIKLRTTRNMSHFELLGFLESYTDILRMELQDVVVRGISKGTPTKFNTDEFEE